MFKIVTFYYQSNKKVTLNPEKRQRICTEINNEFKQNSKFKDTKQKFIDFTQKVWIEETTNDNTGSMLEEEWGAILKTGEVYNQVKAKYDVLYKNSNIEKTAKTNKLIVAILIALLLINIIGIFKYFR